MQNLNNKKEQEANQLWSSFKRQKPQKFWKQYENLIEQNKTAHPSKISQDNSASMAFEPSFENNLSALALGAVVIMLLFINLGMAISQGSSMNAFLPFVTLICIGGAVQNIWKLNHFCFYENFLLIKKSVFPIKYQMKWEHIKSMSIETRYQRNASYHVLIIYTNNGTNRTVRFSVPKESQPTFIAAITGKNILVHENNQERGF